MTTTTAAPVVIAEGQTWIRIADGRVQTVSRYRYSYVYLDMNTPTEVRLSRPKFLRLYRQAA